MPAARWGPRSAMPSWFTAGAGDAVAASLFFVALDFERPFSASKALAQFFKGEPELIPIVVAQPDFLSYAGPPLSGYLGHQHLLRRVRRRRARGAISGATNARARGASEDEIVARDLAVFAGTGPPTCSSSPAIGSPGGSAIASPRSRRTRSRATNGARRCTLQKDLNSSCSPHPSYEILSSPSVSSM